MDPMQFFERYRLLFFEHLRERVTMETGVAPEISRVRIRFMGKTPCDLEEGAVSHYSHMVYEVSFHLDITLGVTTRIDIDKWVDVASCRVIGYSAPEKKYVYEIKILKRDPF